MQKGSRAVEVASDKLGPRSGGRLYADQARLILRSLGIEDGVC
jgi:hypothetical protein